MTFKVVQKQSIKMKIINKLFKYINDRDYRFIINKSLGLYDSMPDEQYLKRLFKIHMGYELNLDNPKTFSEKLQWLKLYNRKSEYTMMVDKYEVREYVEQKLGNEYLIPLLGVWNSPEEIDFSSLPNQFVLKCNHDSGGLCICKDKNKFDIEKAKNKLRRSLNTDYYLKFREWPYKDVPRKIICEKFMVDESGTELKDYKFFCFNGIPKFLYIASNRQTGHPCFDFFDVDFNHLPFTQKDHPTTKVELKKPNCFDKMLSIASILSENIPHVRIDLYNINGKIYFGEMTFFQMSGLCPIEPIDWDFKIGELLDLSLIYSKDNKKYDFK